LSRRKDTKDSLAKLGEEAPAETFAIVAESSPAPMAGGSTPHRATSLGRITALVHPFHGDIYHS